MTTTSQRLVIQALTLGFKGIDTANQRRHYFEEGVGLGIQQFLKSSQKTRGDLFIQTKFTSVHGQDNRKPYDEFDSLTNQLKQSFASSLEHLQTDYIDSYILHGPALSHGIIDADLEIWQAMEALVLDGKVKVLGISNVNIDHPPAASTNNPHDIFLMLPQEQSHIFQQHVYSHRCLPALPLALLLR